MANKVIVLTGSMGAGKTTVLAEMSDLLAAAGVVHAAIDMDAFGSAHLTEPRPELACDNVAAVWRNYSAAGITRLVIAEALETREELDRLRAALSPAEILVCRLSARIETMEKRVAARERGMLRDRFVARVAALERLVSDAAVEDFVVTTEDRNVTDIARDVLARSGWL